MAKGIKTGGRVKGTPNRSSLEIKELARTFAPKAIKDLAWLASNAKSDAARVSAIGLILERGYGKPTQLIGGDEENPITTISRIEWVFVDGRSSKD